jgi:hypothetical protein
MKGGKKHAGTPFCRGTERGVRLAVAVRSVEAAGRQRRNDVFPGPHSGAGASVQVTTYFRGCLRDQMEFIFIWELSARYSPTTSHVLLGNAHDKFVA